MASNETLRKAEWVKNNREKDRARKARWRVKNLEKVQAADTARRAADPERFKAAQQKWRASHPDQRKAACAHWVKNNPDKKRAQRKRHHSKHPEVRRAKRKRKFLKNPFKERLRLVVVQARRRARIAGALGSFTRRDVSDCLLMQGFRCFYCLASLASKFHVDHMHPLSRGGSNGPENIVCACVDCNLRKCSKTVAEFILGP